MNTFTGESITTTLVHTIESTEIDFSQRAMSCRRNSLANKTFNNAKNDDHVEFKPALRMKQQRLGYIWTWLFISDKNKTKPI